MDIGLHVITRAEYLREYRKRPAVASAKAKYAVEYRLKNRESINAYQREWRKQHPTSECREKRQARQKAWWATNLHRRKGYVLNARYGISIEQWQEKFAEQGERCPICKTSDPGKRGWQTEHCHATGRFRGIVCTNCNTMLGHAKDDPLRLHAAADYLERNC